MKTGHKDIQISDDFGFGLPGFWISGIRIPYLIVSSVNERNVS